MKNNAEYIRHGSEEGVKGETKELQELGSDSFGVVRKVEFNFPDGRKRLFAEKTYCTHIILAKEHIQHSVDVYNACKKAGIPTYTTYRREKTRKIKF